MPGATQDGMIRVRRQPVEEVMNQREAAVVRLDPGASSTEAEIGRGNSRIDR